MAETRSALVVDDERDIRELLVMTLGRMGLRCDTASTLGEARSQLSRNRYDLCLTDMRLPDGSGMDLVAEISQKHPDTPVAMITAFGNVEAAVEALKAGAFDFVAKPVDLAVLRDLVRHALDLNESRRSAPPADAVAARLYGQSAGHGHAAPDHRQGRAQPGAGLHRRRVRRGQGTGRPHHPRRRRRAPAARSFRSTAARSRPS